MFNSDAKGKALRRYERAVTKYDRVRGQVVEACVSLHETREQTVRTIQPVEDYVNRLANSPKEFKKAIAEYRLNADRFEASVEAFETESDAATLKAGGAATAGVAAGAGVAAFGPTAAMAVATTFGTASTGTAIGSLSGAAATNAALAWLGGGAISVGGGGMAAGNTFLALAGPVGWAIGAATLVGAGAFYSSRNKSIAKRAAEATAALRAETASLEASKVEIEALQSSTERCRRECQSQLRELEREAPSDYRGFSQPAKERLAALINNVRSLGELIATQHGG